MLTRSLAEQEGKTTGPGKRRAKRALVRLGAVRDARHHKTPAAQPAKGK